MRRIRRADIAKEVGAILPVHVLDVDEAEVRLVDESGCLKAVAGPFARHASAGDSPQFAVDDGDQPLQSRLVTGPPRQEEPRHVGSVGMNS
jgi:hypothetical protein